ncbi:hypothetical protein Misp06_03809 [Microbulbifer sp. NBRC 101763]
MQLISAGTIAPSVLAPAASRLRPVLQTLCLERSLTMACTETFSTLVIVSSEIESREIELILGVE